MRKALHNKDFDNAGQLKGAAIAMKSKAEVWFLEPENMNEHEHLRDSSCLMTLMIDDSNVKLQYYIYAKDTAS